MLGPVVAYELERDPNGSFTRLKREFGVKYGNTTARFHR